MSLPKKGNQDQKLGGGTHQGKSSFSKKKRKNSDPQDCKKTKSPSIGAVFGVGKGTTIQAGGEKGNEKKQKFFVGGLD